MTGEQGQQLMRELGTIRELLQRNDERLGRMAATLENIEGNTRGIESAVSMRR